jgi:hypothetical protein
MAGLATLCHGHPERYDIRAMSCRFSVSGRRSVAALLGESEVADLYDDLADADRYLDFRWLALSQGVPVERIEELWRFLRAAR